MAQILKNVISSWLRIILGISIVSLLLLWIVLFIWGPPWKSYKLTEKYLTIWDYTIWKQQYYNNICSTSSWCLDWEIKWLKEINQEIYLFIQINHWNWTAWDKKFYGYTLYKWKPTLFESTYKYDNKLTVNDLNDLPKFWHLSNNKLKFYSENDLSKLPQEQQNIFKELEKNPTIVIDGMDYTKK